MLVLGIGALGQIAPAPAYHVIVASEAADAISHLAFDGVTLSVDRTIPVGLMPNDMYEVFETISTLDEAT